MYLHLKWCYLSFNSYKIKWKKKKTNIRVALWKYELSLNPWYFLIPLNVHPKEEKKTEKNNIECQVLLIPTNIFKCTSIYDITISETQPMLTPMFWKKSFMKKYIHNLSMYLAQAHKIRKQKWLVKIQGNGFKGKPIGKYRYKKPLR